MIIILYSWACVKPYHDTGMEAPHNLPRRWMFSFYLHFVSFVAVAPGNVCQRVHTDISWLRLPSGLLPRHGRLLGPYIPWICKCAHESLLVFQFNSLTVYPRRFLHELNITPGMFFPTNRHSFCAAISLCSFTRNHDLVYISDHVLRNELRHWTQFRIKAF